MINESELSKGDLRKLNSLRKQLGDEIAEEAFAKYLAQKKTVVEKEDPVINRIKELLEPVVDDKSFNLGRNGYTIRRAGRGGHGFIVYKNETKQK